MALHEFEAMMLMSVDYFQPVTRAELSKVFGKGVSRDTIAALRGAGLISSGRRSPTPGAPHTMWRRSFFCRHPALKRYVICLISKVSRTRIAKPARA